MAWHPEIIDIPGELTRNPFVYAIELGEIEAADQMPIVLCALFRYFPIVPVDSNSLVVVGYRKGQDLAVQLLLAFHGAKELGRASYGMRRTRCILQSSVSRSPALHFTSHVRNEKIASYRRLCLAYLCAWVPVCADSCVPSCRLSRPALDLLVNARVAT